MRVVESSASVENFAKKWWRYSLHWNLAKESLSNLMKHAPVFILARFSTSPQTMQFIA
jgi:hypothetical protein